ncbi:MAG: hypothetical protein GY946_11675 [bacterium]|nr:hypothetical protein [bacterium]
MQLMNPKAPTTSKTVDGTRVFARLDHSVGEELPEGSLAGQKVQLLIKDDGDRYFQLDRNRGGLGQLLTRVRAALT